MAARKKQRASTTGKGRNVQADQTNWRIKLQQNRIKFDDEQKRIYLDHLSRTGLKGRSAEVADVNPATVQRHLENDPDFAEAYEMALESYRDVVSAEVHRRGVEGVVEGVYGKDGRVYETWHDDDGHPIMRNKETGKAVYFTEYREMEPEQRKTLLEPIVGPAWVRKYSDGLLTLEVRRVDPTYREKSSVDMNHAGGVMVAPPGMTPEEWMEEQAKANAGKPPPDGVEDPK